MGKALYRKYRSSSFDEVIGQDHITTTLKRSLKSGTIAHAYLLAGPRGVGKTSVARILAYEVNGLPYDENATHMDIIEIDAASNRRIDEIRNLRERVRIAPVSAKYKVYIIDEVHMLTREAFNALLKTLEEPPDHAIFILATTEMHKLPDTIVSRCITFTFHPIDPKQLARHLKFIAKSEKIDISEDALELLAEYGDGSFRDSISLLDQVRDISAKVSAEDIELALGLAPDKIIDGILDAVTKSDPKALDVALSEAYKFGASDLNIAKQLAAKVRQQLIENNLAVAAHEATDLLKNLLDVPSAPNPHSRLEICLLDILFRSDVSAPRTQSAKAKTMEEKPLEGIDKSSVDVMPADIEADQTPLKTVSVPEPRTIPAQAVATIEADSALWNKILNKLKNQNNTLYSVARMAEAKHHGKTLTLSFRFPFHFKQVNNPKNKSLLEVIIDELGHEDVGLDIRLMTDNSTAPAKSAAARGKGNTDPNMANITNIFGSGEMLES